MNTAIATRLERTAKGYRVFHGHRSIGRVESRPTLTGSLTGTGRWFAYNRVGQYMNSFETRKAAVAHLVADWTA